MHTTPGLVPAVDNNLSEGWLGTAIVVGIVSNTIMIILAIWEQITSWAAKNKARDAARAEEIQHKRTSARRMKTTKKTIFDSEYLGDVGICVVEENAGVSSSLDC